MLLSNSGSNQSPNTSDDSAKRLKTFKMKENMQPEPVTNTSDSLSRFSFGGTSANPKSTPPSSRPSSHHRRRSSVSTRRESAEIMGVCPAALNDLPTSDDADTDGFRRRALWALEGRPNDNAVPSPANSFASGYSKVEIPELTTPDLDDQKFDLSIIPTLTMGNNSKRDSFGRDRDPFGRVLTPSLSSKDQLHTLLEEDEEEEEENKSQPLDTTNSIQAPAQIKANTISHLKPLTLTPTPIVIPSTSPSFRTGLKPLTLATSPPLISSPSVTGSRGIQPNETGMKRRSSLSYKRSHDVASSGSFVSNPLPTPELTPTTQERPLSPSEQAFFQNNHASLLSRITELERVLSVRTRTMSIASMSSRQLSVSSFSSEPPSDELLNLVRDLKAERDDLTREVAVWTTRVDDLEKQISTLTRRVENERREAWLAREKAGLLEVEKRRIQNELDLAHSETNSLRDTLAKLKASEQSALSLLENERTKRKAVETELERQIRESRIHRNGPSSRRSLASSLSSMTDVEHEIQMPTAPLKVVKEEEEEEYFGSDDELAHYEDEEDEDAELYSNDSFDDNTRSPFSPLVAGYSHLNNSQPSQFNQTVPLPSPSSAASSTPPPTPSPLPPLATHKRKSSLEQGWTFPKSAPATAKEAPEVDRFFQCLEFDDTSPQLSSTPSPFIRDDIHTKDKYGFFKSNDDDDEDEDEDNWLPFALPSQRTSTVSETPSLDVVLEEDEDGDSTSRQSTISPIAIKVSSPDSPPLRRKPVPTLERNSAISSSSPSWGLPPIIISAVDEDASNFGYPTPPSMKPAQPKTTLAPTFIPAPRATAMIQTPRKTTGIPLPPRAIGSSNQPQNSVYPATPTSIPRIKSFNNSVFESPRRAEGMAPNPATPTKIPVSRVMNTTNSQSASPSSTTSLTLKSSSGALTALANFLPWGAWSNSEQHQLVGVKSHNSEGNMSARGSIISDRDGLKFDNNRMSVRTTTNRSDIATQKKIRGDGLVLL